MAWFRRLKVVEIAVIRSSIYLFIYLLGANQNEHGWQMVWKEMRDQCIVERVYVLHKIWQA